MILSWNKILWTVREFHLFRLMLINSVAYGAGGGGGLGRRSTNLDIDEISMQSLLVTVEPRPEKQGAEWNEPNSILNLDPYINRCT